MCAGIRGCCRRYCRQESGFSGGARIPVGLSFAQKTVEAAVAALGDDIRNWPDASPVTLQDPAYVGVAVMAMQGRAGYTRIRTPYVSDSDAAHVAEAWQRMGARPAARRTPPHRPTDRPQLGMTQKAARAVLRVSFAKVAEYQKRGLVHFHAVIRLDGPGGSTQPPPPDATAALLADSIQSAAARVQVTIESDAIGERTLAWGEQLDVREISAFGTDAELTDQAVAAYVAKYATKSADASGTLDRALFCRPCQGRGAMLTAHGTPIQCTACTGTGQARSLPRLAVARHVRQMIRTCWELDKRPEFADLKLWKWAHMLGFRGHFSTKSRCYSVTLGALRDARRAWRTWRTEQARAQAGLPDLDPTTTLVLGHWSYLGSNYSPGAGLLAAGVWHRRELERQFVAEGGC
ncbi:replication initiator [Streptomyces sp. NBC_00057]|uniref:replication initiator n=1 Tax=Streptomyces sp. NBC_00057 TaxID=2975634 RepID=UPI00324DCE7D